MVTSPSSPFAAAVPVDRIRYNDQGLVPAIVQDHLDGTVLMMAWMNAESLRRTLDSGETWFWSRSRQEFWHKGETSGHLQYVKDIRYDCDSDALLVTVEQVGDIAGYDLHHILHPRHEALVPKVSAVIKAMQASGELDKLVKDGESGEDEVRRAEKSLDDTTHKYVAQIDELLKHKEAELLEV